MAENRLWVNHSGDSIRLSWQRGQTNPRFAPSVSFQHPFDEQALADLRWYLEEYLRFPYGIEPQKAAKIEQNFQEWGQQLFELVFRSSEKGREFFQEATREGLDRCEIGIASDNPKVLNLPWELLYSPDYQFIAPLLAGMYRSLSTQAVRAPMGNLPDDKLNILLAIARPYGERDVSFKTIARSMLEALKPIRRQINLKVLRPPSFEEFERELNAHKQGFYHIVHFDGHGTFNPQSQGQEFQLGGETEQGELVFESLDGSEQVISADRIAQSLANCRVPVFILNACKSAQEGEEKFSSVATRFIFSGAKGVVAMVYTVHAEAAKQFMGRLYGELVRGMSLSEAVAAARLTVLNHPLRSSPKGDLPLRDWLVPVLYQQEPHTPFTPKKEAPSLAELMAQTESPSEETQGLPEEGAFGFVGRDYDILRLERAFRQNYAVLLKGMGGVGKTQLAGGFARWLADTQGRTAGIFFTSFESGAGLSNVVNDIGRALMGDAFSRYPFEQQEKGVLQYLQTNPCLLIWDNFEPVVGFPTGNEPLLPASERDNLKKFLKALRGGQSWVLIASRREESWLDCGYTLLPLGGLSQSDAEELAAKILQTAGVDRRKLPEEYLELLKLLGGHPLSLRVVLPHLKTQTPVQLIEALRQGLDTFKGTEEEGRDKSLTVSLDYSFAKLSEHTRKHLPFLALFSERVDADLLRAFSESPDNKYGEAYRAVFGDNLQKSDWHQILNEAAEASILEHLGSTIYKIHPALPWYLRQRLAEENSQEAIAQLEKKLLVLYAVLANNYRKQLIGNAELATFVLRVEEPNLLQNLRLAEQQQDWAEAQAILQALGEVYERWGRKPEFKSLRQRALNQIGINLAQAKAKGKDAFNFWIYLRGEDAKDALAIADLEGGRAIHQEILDELTALNDPSVNDRIAVANHQLGVVAEEQGRCDEAIAYYQKALKIRKYAGDWYKAASDYHELGMVAEEQGRFDEAIAYYQKALEIYEDAGDWYKAATVYHQLGMVAQKQGWFDEAIAYYQKALKIYEDAGDWYKAASDYHQLGVIAQQQRQFDEAIAYYQKAMKIFEDAQDWYNAADEYHLLGRVAQEQQEQRQFDEAIAYYQKAFAVFQQFQDWWKASDNLSKWGNVLEAQENWTEAVKIYIGVLAIDIKHNQEWIGSDIRDLGRMLKVLGESQFEAIWREVTGGECTGEVREAIWRAAEQGKE
ncbi:MAG: tetratricopeptide repeat protein [Xenococcaceae cyanobacterium]